MTDPVAVRVATTDDDITFDLADGRSVSAPLEWFPRLAHATPAERQNCRLSGGGAGAHWPDLDEDVSVINLLSGKRSAETPKSFKQWLASRPPAAAAPTDSQ